MTKQITLTADDYGQDPLISQGIIELAAEKRLSAISCMTETTAWPKASQALLPFRGQIEIGLHINFTHEKTSLAELALRAMSRTLSYRIIEQQLNDQLDAFEQALHQPPDFLDGHQHVHCLPVIRDALLHTYQKRLLATKPYVRLPLMAPQKRLDLQTVKIITIQALGAKRLQAMCQQYHLPHNTTFSGIYAFHRAHDYPAYFKYFLQTIQDHGLIMCHPGKENSATLDHMARARYLEYQYLKSANFIQDCQAADVKISPFQLLRA